jgi:hypothetical protein
VRRRATAAACPAWQGGLVAGDPRVCLIVDVANVMGSRPDGWWRDRAGAATRWLADLDCLVGRSVSLPTGGTATVVELIAVIEGQARRAREPESASLRVVRAEHDGDTAIVEVAEQCLAEQSLADSLPEGVVPLVVTADRGLRDRLPPGVAVAGPGWLRGLLA